ncbi:MAG: hypothetical protein K940chlam8_00724 [Chlamydiae bacterium]|nr:hypothetical protein [Chlamydiota bacterium]
MAIKFVSFVPQLPPFNWERFKVTLPKFETFREMLPQPLPTPSMPSFRLSSPQVLIAAAATTAFVTLIAGLYLFNKYFLNFDDHDISFEQQDLRDVDGSSLNAAIRANLSEEARITAAEKQRKEDAAIIIKAACRGFLAREELAKLREETKYNQEVKGFMYSGDVTNSQINDVRQETYLISPQEIETIRFQVYLHILRHKHQKDIDGIPKSGTPQQKFYAVLCAVRENPRKYSTICKTLFTDMHIYTLAEQLVTIVAKRRFIVTNSLTRNLEKQFAPIDAAASVFSTLESARSAVRRLGAHANFYFNPIAEGNLPFVLSLQTYQGEVPFTTTCMRTPCPVDQGPTGVGIAPEYREFVASSDGPVAYFSLQFDSDEKSDWNGGERLRIEPFRTLEREYADKFHLFSLPMDKRVFKCEKEFETDNVADYKQTLIRAMCTNNFGFYFPQQPSVQTTLQNDLQGLFDQVHTLFFPGKTTLTTAEKQIFLILFYVSIELFYTIKLKLKYKHFSCKDAVDRAGILNIVALRVQQIMLGKEKDHYFSRQLQAYTHLPAFTSRHTSILEHRRHHLIEVLDFLDDFVAHMSEGQKQQLHHLLPLGYTLQDVSMPQQDELILFHPHQVTTHGDYQKALLLDPKTHNPFTLGEVNLKSAPAQMQTAFKTYPFVLNGVRVENIKTLTKRLSDENQAFCTQQAIDFAFGHLQKWYNNGSLGISVQPVAGTKPRFELILNDETRKMRITSEYTLTQAYRTELAKTVFTIDVDFTKKTYTAQFQTVVLA